MQVPKLVLWFMALGFVGFGVAYTVWPLPMARLTEIPLPTPTARIDFGATYGGMQLGFGAFLLLAARRPGWVPAGLRAATAVLLGIGLIRLLGIFLAAGPPQTVIYQGLGIELAGAALSGWAAWRAGRQSN